MNGNLLSRQWIYGTCAVFLLVMVLLPSITYGQPSGQMIKEDNTDHRGGDYTAFDINPNMLLDAALQQCSDACLFDENCKAATFVRPGIQKPEAVCYLKNIVNPATPDSCCVSWTKTLPPGNTCWESNPPTADFSARTTTGTAPLVVVFTDLSTNAQSSHWDYGDGHESTQHSGSEDVHVYNNPGTYTVRLTARKGDYPCIYSDTEEKVNYITVTQPAAATKGTITVNSNPSGATVLVDGVQQQGTTPLSVPNVNAGLHTVTVKKSGYSDYVQSVTVVEGDISTVNAPLSPAAGTTGALSVTSVPTGASVSLDGTPRGTTPATLTGISAGPHALALTLSGYQDYTATVPVVSGQTAVLNAVLTKSAGPGPGTTGSISVTSVPPGASVSLDGIPRGTTPATLTGISAGPHTVTVTMSGYLNYSAAVPVVAGMTAQVTANLVKATGGSTGTTGSLTITSSPAGAGVNFNEWDKGKTPVTVTDLKPGSYPVTLTLAGYVPWQATVTVAAGQTNALVATLVPQEQAQTGTLIVSSSPAGASVLLDGIHKGMTPLTIPDVPAGSHTIMFAMKGFTDYTTQVLVTAGKEQQFSAGLMPAKTPGFGWVTGVLAFGIILCILRLARKD